MKNKLIIYGLSVMSLTLIIFTVWMYDSYQQESDNICYTAHEQGLPCLHQMHLDPFVWVQMTPETIYSLPNGKELVARYQAENISEKLQPAIMTLISLIKEKIKDDDHGHYGMEMGGGDNFILFSQNLCHEDLNGSVAEICEDNSLFVRNQYYDIFDQQVNGLEDTLLTNGEDQINYEPFRRIAPQAKTAFSVVYYDEVLMWTNYLRNYHSQIASEK